jgi:hypothetical protein
LSGRPRPARPATVRHCARRASAHRSGHRSPDARRSAAGGGATVAEVEQGEALEHPWRRGHLSGKWVEAAAHRSFLPTGRMEKPGQRRRSPTRSGWGGRGSSGASVPREKGGNGVLGAPLTVEGFATAEVTGQRRWHARTEARCSDSDVVGFRHGRWRGRDGRTRGEVRVASAARRRLRTLAGWNGF